MSDFDGLDELLNLGTFRKSRGMRFRLRRILAQPNKKARPRRMDWNAIREKNVCVA